MVTTISKTTSKTVVNRNDSRRQCVHGDSAWRIKDSRKDGTKRDKPRTTDCDSNRLTELERLDTMEPIQDRINRWQHAAFPAETLTVDARHRRATLEVQEWIERPDADETADVLITM